MKTGICAGTLRNANCHARPVHCPCADTFFFFSLKLYAWPSQGMGANKFPQVISHHSRFLVQRRGKKGVWVYR